MVVAATPTQAALITFGFTGTVTQVTDPSGVLAGYVEPGTGFAGEFTFESDAVDRDAASHRGSYRESTFFMLMDLGELTLDSTAGLA
jgi:uncharacterized protein RhaS with RHS repeats